MVAHAETIACKIHAAWPPGSKGRVVRIAGGGSDIVNGTGINVASVNSDIVVDGTTLVANATSTYNGAKTQYLGARR